MTAGLAAGDLARLGARSFDAQMVLGDLLAATRKPVKAHAAYALAASLRPMSADARLKLGAALLTLNKPEEAEVELRRAAAIKPESAEGRLALSGCLHRLRRIDEAVECARAAHRLAPKDQRITLFLSGMLADGGWIEESAEVFKAAEQGPQLDPGDHSTALMALNYRDHDPVDVCLEHARRMDLVAAMLGESASRPPLFANRPDPDRRLTIGILSSDLHNHVCMRFMRPLFEHLDPLRFRLVAYANVRRPDSVTEAIRPRFELWRNIVAVNGPAVAQTCRDDGVDILIETSGHTAGTRIDVCAWHAAPVQCTWMGYPNTTGLRSIGWRIVDAVSDPRGESEGHCTERLLRIEQCNWCYRPPGADEFMPGVSPSPVAATGRFTFGSFNNLCKVTPRVVEAWGRILARVPDARLILKDRWKDSPNVLRWVLDGIEAAGASRSQVEVIGFAPVAEFFATYARVDLQLDPFPYNGTTTTCESLWLGVPVLTLEGKWHAARVGTSLMTAAGLPEFIAPSIEAYIEKAVALATDPSPLIALRPALRGRIEAGPLRDEKGYAERFGAALRSAWREWCEKRPTAG
jgi:predicted O-linked N-acetylglucosamine transferase (SPINDLY family)